MAAPGEDRDARVDSEWDERARGETPTERLDRNWADLLQELRVVQTGVQLLTGFLLTLPFQARFSGLGRFQQNAYLVTVACSIGATGLLIAPVSLHRLLFRRHARRVLVRAGHLLALTGLLLLSVAIAGVALLIFDVVRGRTAGWLAAGATFGVIALLWLILPMAVRRRVGRLD
ncbi:MAG: DUF6328 family protein [Jatrophihabitans sp.]